MVSNKPALISSDPLMNIVHLRSETPGCEERIHLNNAGAALMPQPVVRAIQDHIALESRIGGYEAADRSSFFRSRREWE
jgi:hypothetical protein